MTDEEHQEAYRPLVTEASKSLRFRIAAAIEDHADELEEKHGTKVATMAIAEGTLAHAVEQWFRLYVGACQPKRLAEVQEILNRSVDSYFKQCATGYLTAKARNDL